MYRFVRPCVMAAVVLCAPAAFGQDIDFRLVTVTVPSANDTTTVLPDSELDVPVGSMYYVELWASDVGDTNTGITSAYVDLGWESTLATAVDVGHSSIFNVFTSGTIAAGAVDELGGSTFAVAGVQPEWARVALVELTADAEGQATYTLEPSETGVAAYDRGMIPWGEISLDEIAVTHHPDCNSNGVIDQYESVIGDITAEGSFVGKIFSLSPPYPLGNGNPDPQVMRDGDYPPVGIVDTLRQYDTFHEGDQGDEDWMGYEFSDGKMFRSIVFQEGKNFWDGGWFDDLLVQVRVEGAWSDVAGLAVTPPYPGPNGVSFETFELSFEPVEGDAIRIYGNPGGSANFISIGELRVIAGRHPTFDCNGNGVLDECDIASGYSDDYDVNGVPDECEDCKENGIPDACDVDCGVGDCASHPLGCGGYADCNGNLIPDECIDFEHDCNANGTPDECDIASEDSYDYDLNGVPDECEDCNENGIPDGCDLDCDAGDCADYYPDSCGGSSDCNKNGVPDECDIAEGTSADCQPNGIPDECELSRFPGILAENTTGQVDSRFTGPPDDVLFSGIGGQIVTYDFGAPRIFDLDGPEFNVYELDRGEVEFDAIDVLVSADGVEFFSVEASEGPVVRVCGDGAHGDDAFARSYDLGQSGLTAVRFIRIDGDGDGPGGDDYGFELDAIGAINRPGDCNDNGLLDECDCRDLDGDNDVDLEDLALLLGNYGTITGATYEDGNFDCDGDVDLADLAELLGHYGETCDQLPVLLVGSRRTDEVLAYDGESGNFIRVVAGPSSGLDHPNGIAFDDDSFYVASVGTDSVIEFSLLTGEPLLEYSGGGLDAPDGVLLAESTLLVSSYATNSVKEFDRETAVWNRDLVFSGNGGLDGPAGLAWSTSGNLLVASQLSDEVLEYDGETGDFIRVAAMGNGLDGPEGLVLDADGNVLVASFYTSSVLRYSPNGAFLDAFVASGDGGLSGASGLAWTASGNLLVASRYTDNVLEYCGTDGAFVGVFASDGGLDGPTHAVLAQFSDP